MEVKGRQWRGDVGPERGYKNTSSEHRREKPKIRKEKNKQPV